MTDQHPITPPPELVKQWVTEVWHEGTPARLSLSDMHIATEAARWGADTELEASLAELKALNLPDGYAKRLRAARRPKPPSLKEQATFAAAVLQSPDETCSIAEIAQHWHTIRRALEAMPND
jgi:hypothetical protein